MNGLLHGSLPDVGAYLERIGYRGDTRPSPTVLAALQAHHAEHIAFENLSPFLGEPVSLETPDLQAKMVDQPRGGYCFEQNLLLASALTEMGFAVTGLAARVFWNRPEYPSPPRTHMLLKVTVDGADYAVDAGFGGMTPTGPLRLDTDGLQETPHEPFRVLDDGLAPRVHRVQTRLDGAWWSLYAFDLQPQQLADYQLTSWYLNHHPRSRFVTDIIASRPGPDCRHSLVNSRHTTRHLDGREDRRRLTRVEELIEVLESVFGVRRDYDRSARRRLQRRLDETCAD